MSLEKMNSKVNVIVFPAKPLTEASCRVKYLDLIGFSKARRRIHDDMLYMKIYFKSDLRTSDSPNRSQNRSRQVRLRMKLLLHYLNSSYAIDGCIASVY